MSLIQLNGPAVLSTVGDVTQILNAKQPGAQGMEWGYENNGGIIRGVREYTNTLRVFTSSPYVGPVQIQQALVGIGAVQGSYYRFPLPELNPPSTGSHDYAFPTTPTEVDTGSFLHGVSIRQETEDARQWLCTFTYGPQDLLHNAGDVSEGTVNPLTAAPDVKWTPVVRELSYPTDINGVPFINNVGDPLIDAPKREVAEQTLSFTRNEATYDKNWAKKYSGSLNLNEFLGYDAKQAKCKIITGDRIYSADFGYYWRVNYEFDFRRIEIKSPATIDPLTGVADDSEAVTNVYGWEDLVINQGFREVDDSGKLKQIILNGIPITSPVPIGADQKAYNIENTPNAPIPPPYYLVFDQYPQLDFDFLNIPQTVFTDNQ